MLWLFPPLLFLSDCSLIFTLILSWKLTLYPSSLYELSDPVGFGHNLEGYSGELACKWKGAGGNCQETPWILLIAMRFGQHCIKSGADAALMLSPNTWQVKGKKEYPGTCAESNLTLPLSKATFPYLYDPKEGGTGTCTCWINSLFFGKGQIASSQIVPK